MATYTDIAIAIGLVWLTIILLPTLILLGGVLAAAIFEGYASAKAALFGLPDTHKWRSDALDR